MASLVGPIYDDSNNLVVNATLTVSVVTGSAIPAIGPGNKLILPVTVKIDKNGDFPPISRPSTSSIVTPSHPSYRVTLNYGAYGETKAWNIVIPDDETYNLADGSLVVLSPSPPDWIPLSGPEGKLGPPGPSGPPGTPASVYIDNEGFVATLIPSGDGTITLDDDGFVAVTIGA